MQETRLIQYKNKLQKRFSVQKTTLKKKTYFMNSIKGEYKTSVRTFDPREINRKITEKVQYNTREKKQ